MTLPGCWLPKIPGDDGAEEMVGDGDGDGEDTGTETGQETETGEPPVDLPEGDGDGDGDPDPGWCCECWTDPMSCTPSSEDACEGDTYQWCELDEQGNPTTCVDACGPEPAGWCCECDVWIGGGLSCSPSESADCNSEGFEWCELDQWGTTHDCELACES